MASRAIDQTSINQIVMKELSRTRIVTNWAQTPMASTILAAKIDSCRPISRAIKGRPREPLEFGRRDAGRSSIQMNAWLEVMSCTDFMSAAALRPSLTRRRRCHRPRHRPLRPRHHLAHRTPALPHTPSLHPSQVHNRLYHRTQQEHRRHC